MDPYEELVRYQALGRMQDARRLREPEPFLEVRSAYRVDPDRITEEEKRNHRAAVCGFIILVAFAFLLAMFYDVTALPVVVSR